MLRTRIADQGLSPRVRGTEPSVVTRPMLTGLSPRVRGNRGLMHTVRQYLGSIPARAGEPLARVVLRRVALVYPRACGGTAAVPATTTYGEGLSPRVRGNRIGHDHQNRFDGSIPARAGEPPAAFLRCAYAWVYPRACGGT